MSVTVEKLIKDFDLEVLVEGKPNELITVNDINRPGLQLAGFYNYFAPERLQVIGKAEWSFLDDMQVEFRKKRLNKYFTFPMHCIIMSRGLEPHEELINAANKKNIWVLRSNLVTTKLMSNLTIYLSDKLAPETRLHGVLVDVSGIGIEIDGELIGSSPSITRGMLEVRGIGIIDVPALYGISSILLKKTITLVMHFEHWKDDNDYDRLGNNFDYMDILGVPVRKLTVPVRPGRNIAVIIEAAAVNYRYSLMSNVSAVDIIESRMNLVSDK